MRVELDAPQPPGQANRPAEGQGRPGPSMTERQRAIGLPLVKDVLDAFPDAVLMDTRREETEVAGDPADTPADRAEDDMD